MTSLVADLDDAADEVDGKIADPEHRPLAVGLQLMAQRRPHPGEQLVHAERLGHVVVGAEIERLDLAGFVAAAGEDDDGNAFVARADRAQQIVAQRIGQAEIENDQVGSLFQQIERGLAVRGLQRLITLRGQAHAQQLAYRRLVVDHQYAERSCTHAAASRRWPWRGIGRLMVNAAPLRSERFAATMVPCIASTKPREMASPSPVPARTWSVFCAR